MRVPIGNVVGDVDDGWRVARATLSYEHGIANLGQQVRLAETVERIVAIARDRGVDDDLWAGSPTRVPTSRRCAR
jgi:alkylation response protein AidB-like acyl-CoA dehydrogenase